MPIAASARVHPTAIIDPQSDLAEGVQVGPHVVVEGPVRIGPNCVLRPGAHLIGPLTMGCDNVVFSYAVLGEQPQHVKYNGEPTRLEIGDQNVFREFVTVHRGTVHSWVTRIGNGNFLMANAHVAHDCVIGDRCMLVNGCMMGGHCTLGDNVILSGNSVLHQFVRVGRLALLSGLSGAGKDIPPFIMQQRVNCVVGVNVVGMRRAGIPSANIDAVRRAFHTIYRSGLTVSDSVNQVERELGTVAEVAEMVAFIRGSTRGIILHLDRDAA
jgi:UDP-N-acetylglucosamine acyltransferase